MEKNGFSTFEPAQKKFVLVFSEASRALRLGLLNKAVQNSRNIDHAGIVESTASHLSDATRTLEVLCISLMLAPPPSKKFVWTREGKHFRHNGNNLDFYFL